MDEHSRREFYHALAKDVAKVDRLEREIRKISSLDSYLSTIARSQNPLEGKHNLNHDDLVPVKDYSPLVSQIKTMSEASKNKRQQLLEELSSEYDEVSRSIFEVYCPGPEELQGIFEWYEELSELWNNTKQRQVCEIRIRNILVKLDKLLGVQEGTGSLPEQDVRLNNLLGTLEALLATTRNLKNLSEDFKNRVEPREGLDNNLALRLARVTSGIADIQNSHIECHSEIDKIKETILEENSKIHVAPVQLSEEIAQAIEAKLNSVVEESFKKTQEHFLGGLNESLSALAFMDPEDPLVQTTHTSDGTTLA